MSKKDALKVRYEAGEVQSQYDYKAIEKGDYLDGASENH